MKKFVKIAAISTALTLAAGCATPLTSAQKMELNGYQGKGIAVEEKNPTAAAALGLLPGGGSFYTRNYGLGVINLLLWPLSILWDPMSGYDGALAVNYYATKQVVDQRRSNDLRRIEDSMLAGTISKEEYVIEKRRIEDQYLPY